MKGDPALAERLKQGLRIPVMAGPMFIASTPALVVAQCRSGVIGAMSALNARKTELLDDQIAAIEKELIGCPVPFAINLVAHKSNARLDADLEVVVGRKVPMVVLALATSPPLSTRSTATAASSSTMSRPTGMRGNARNLEWTA